MVALYSGEARKHGAAAVRLEHVDHCERQVARIGRERAGASFASLLPGAGIGRRGRKLAQQRKLPLADDPLGVVGVGAEDAADRAVVCGNRAVREGVVGLFRIAVALHDEELGLDVGAFIAVHGAVTSMRADLVPDLAPDESTRAFRAAHGCLPPMIDL